MIYQCECPFTTSERADFIDHLLEVFDPGPSDLGTDGQAHAELAGPEKRMCSCGFAAPNWPAMDAHLLAAFVTPNGIGTDGGKHSTALPAVCDSTQIHYGNAVEDGSQTRGWLVGHFIGQEHGIRSSRDVEIKWGIHPAGDKRPEWTTVEHRSTIVVLLDGKFRIDLRSGSVMLERRGDYVMWGPGTDHSWEAVSDSTVLTVRWPSLA
jgi:hypothetical protein